MHHACPGSAAALQGPLTRVVAQLELLAPVARLGADKVLVHAEQRDLRSRGKGRAGVWVVRAPLMAGVSRPACRAAVLRRLPPLPPCLLKPVGQVCGLGLRLQIHKAHGRHVRRLAPKHRRQARRGAACSAGGEGKGGRGGRRKAASRQERQAAWASLVAPSWRALH